MSTRTHEKDTGGFRYISVKPAKIAQMEQKDLLFAQRPSEQTVSLRREFERSGNYAERIHFGPRIFNTREWDVQRKWDPKRKASAVADAFLFGGPEGIRTLDLSDANRTRSQTVHLYAPQTTRKSTLIHRILSQKIRKCIWPRFILRLKMSTNRSKKLSCIITRILLGCQHNGNNTVRIPLGEC